MAATVSGKAAPTSAEEQRVVLHDVSWETYERLLADFVDRPVPRFTYDRGTLEMLVILSTEHEDTKHALTSIVEAITVERGIDIRIVGSMTFQREDLTQGFEPDVTFYVEHEPEVRGVTQIDPMLHPPPDLVIEIDVSRRSLNKLPIYAAFGVPEVWRVRGGIVMVDRLGTDRTGYDEGNPSLALPPLDGPTLTRFLTESKKGGRAAWVRSVRQWASQAG